VEPLLVSHSEACCQPYKQILIRLKILSDDKHSSLFRTFEKRLIFAETVAIFAEG
jgi:hypothetical protein